MIETSRKRTVFAEGMNDDDAADGDGGCWAWRTDAVPRPLRGEDLDTVSRSLGVTAATLSGWLEAFLDGGEAATKPIDGEERESDSLKARLINRRE